MRRLDRKLIGAGIDDWGGVSPVTPDHVNPEAPWPAIEKLREISASRGRVLVDGNRLPSLRVPAEAVVKGDDKVPAISAASILAKVHRDRLCEEMHARWPDYGFATHKGYPTAEHLAALRVHGATPVHRRSFGPVRVALQERA